MQSKQFHVIRNISRNKSVWAHFGFLLFISCFHLKSNENEFEIVEFVLPEIYSLIFSKLKFDLNVKINWSSSREWNENQRRFSWIPKEPPVHTFNRFHSATNITTKMAEKNPSQQKCRHHHVYRIQKQYAPFFSKQNSARNKEDWCEGETMSITRVCMRFRKGHSA